MNDWKYSFDPVSKKDWIRRIEKDLKNKSPDSLETEWWPGEKVFPFHHKDDSTVKVVLPDNFFRQPPLVTEWIETSDKSGDTINQHVIRSLKFGANAFVFEIRDNKPDVHTWLKGVFTEMIDVNFQISGLLQDMDWVKKLPPESSLRLSDNGLNSNLSLQDSTETSPVKIVYSIPSTGNWIEEVLKVFLKIQHGLKSWLETKNDAWEFFNNCILLFTPDNGYLKQIIQTRALQLVWLNFINKYINRSNISSPIEIQILPGDNADPDNYLIKASSTFLAASLTGVRSVCVRHMEQAENFYERIDRNIHHLLQLESNIYQGIDPLAGSYAIDHYTKDWAQRILQKL